MAEEYHFRFGKEKYIEKDIIDAELRIAFTLPQ